MNIIPIDTTPIIPINTIPTLLTESWLTKLFDYIHKPGILPRFGKVGFYTLIFIIICIPMYYVLSYTIKPQIDDTTTGKNSSNKSTNKNKPGYIEAQYTNFKFDTYNLYRSIIGSSPIIISSKQVKNKLGITKAENKLNEVMDQSYKPMNGTQMNLIYSLIFGWIGVIICMIIIT